MGVDGTPKTILVGYDGKTTAFFASVGFCEGTSQGTQKRTLAVNVLSTGESGLTERPGAQRHRRQTQSKQAHPNQLDYEESPL